MPFTCLGLRSFVRQRIHAKWRHAGWSPWLLCSHGLISMGIFGDNKHFYSRSKTTIRIVACQRLEVPVAAPHLAGAGAAPRPPALKSRSWCSLKPSTGPSLCSDLDTHMGPEEAQRPEASPFHAQRVVGFNEEWPAAPAVNHGADAPRRQSSLQQALSQQPPRLNVRLPLKRAGAGLAPRGAEPATPAAGREQHTHPGLELHISRASSQPLTIPLGCARPGTGCLLWTWCPVTLL